MMVSEQSELFSKRLLLLLAHPDDECIGAGILLQRNPTIHTVFVTSGAPNRPYTWRRFGTPGRCARIRRAEAKKSLSVVGAPEPAFLNFPDGKLYRNLKPAYKSLSDVVATLCPSAILTHAFEGGHPDHDACSFLSARLAHAFALNVWEMPYYRPDQSGAGRGLILQQFLPGNAEPLLLTPSAAELHNKGRMFEAHRSQNGVLASFHPARECFRRQPAYDYCKQASPGLNAIGPSRVRTRDLVAAFQEFARS